MKCLLFYITYDIHAKPEWVARFILKHIRYNAIYVFVHLRKLVYLTYFTLSKDNLISQKIRVTIERFENVFRVESFIRILPL